MLDTEKAGLPAPSETMDTHLASLNSAVGFNRWMFSQYEPWIQWGKIWEIGSGTGNMSGFLQRAEIACLTEYDPQFRQELMRRFHGKEPFLVEPVDLTRLDIPHFRAYGFDTVISTNVLEHIENDVAAVRGITATMKPGATLITLVPAHPLLYGALDKFVGHYRRYTKASLRAALEAGGQEVVEMKYFNRVSALGWFLKFRVLRSESISEGDVAIVERLLPLMKLEKFLPLPFGQSLIAVSRPR